MMDLHIYTIYRTEGQDRGDLSGVLALNAPKRAARGRAEEILLVSLTLTGNMPYPPAFQQEILTTMANVYFASAGPATSGLRAAVDNLNDVLMKRNLKGTREGLQAVGSLNLAVIRRNILYLAHAGATSSFFITQEGVQQFSDLTGSERGLGISKSVTLRFYQVEIHQGDLLLMSAAPPAGWTVQSLQGSAGLNLDPLRRRLFGQGGSALRAVMVRFMEGKGLIFRRRLSETAMRNSQPVFEAVSPVEPSPIPATAKEGSEIPTEGEAQPSPEQIAALESLFTRPATSSRPIPPQTTTPNAPLPTQRTSPGVPERTSPPGRPTTSSVTNAARPKVQPVQLNRFKKGAARSILGWERFWQRIGNGLNSFISRVLPGAGGGLPRISTGSMILISILVPVIVVSIAMTVYIRTGRIEQHETNLQMAQTYAVQAAAASGTEEQRALYSQALDYLDQAEHYGIDEETQSLRTQLQARLDVLEGVTRLTFSQLIPDGLPSSVNIIRISSFGDDLYILDGNTGSVLRLSRIGRSRYAVDQQFVCGPAPFGEITVGPLIDMVGLPPNAVTVDVRGTPGATVMGLDSAGHVIYCAPGNSPRAAQLGNPSLGWGTVDGMALSNQDTLVILDKMSNRVWRFDETSTEDAEGHVTDVQDLTYTSQPGNFFDNEVPERLDQVIDLALYNEYLYLLRDDTTMERCDYSHLKEIRLTECNPAVLQDMRYGNQPIPLPTAGLEFNQIQVVTLPDIGVYILEAGEGDLYKFGVDLNLYQILRPGAAEGYRLPSGQVTAFTITNSQYVYLAYGNQIFYSRIR